MSVGDPVGAGFIASGAAAGWPLAARAQQDGRVRLIGWLDHYDENAITTALRQGLAKLGWVEGRNLKIERRFGAGDANRLQPFAGGRPANHCRMEHPTSACIEAIVPKMSQCART